VNRVSTIAAFLLAAAAASAQPGAPAAMRPSGDGRPGIPTVEGKLPEPLKDVSIQQRLDAQLPMDVELVGPDGRSRPFKSFFRGKPVVLAFVYYECKMLCNMTMLGLVRAMNAIPNLSAGKDFDVVAVSFDPAETPAIAAKKMADFAPRYRRGGLENGLQLLTGSAANVKRLADAAGFRYSWDGKTNQWAHSSAILVVTPEGKISKYFYGVEYSARDLRLGMIDASQGRIGSPVDQVLLFCYHYDPTTGKYGMVIMTLLRAAGLLTVGLIIAFWIVSYFQNKRRKNLHGERFAAFSR
jgi:protein SCO1/2